MKRILTCVLALGAIVAVMLYSFAPGRVALAQNPANNPVVQWQAVLSTINNIQAEITALQQQIGTKTPPTLVSALPPCTSINEGTYQDVTDCTDCVFGGQCTDAGQGNGVFCHMECTGVAWLAF